MHPLASIPPSISHVATAVGAVALAGWFEASGLAPAIAAVVVIASVAAWVDLRSARIPDELVLMAGVPVFALLANGAAVADVALGVLVFAAPLLLVHLVSPQSLGFGDVKLGVPLGAAVGAVHPLLGLVALCIASGATGIVGLIRRRRSLPFAPGLVVGTAMALVVAATSSTDWPLSWR